MAVKFDVFFSYATRDHLAVEAAARALTDRGFSVFLDRWYLVPGQPWPRALEQTLGACSAVAVFIGDDGLGPWQQRERDLALDRQGREPGFPVIPVLLTHTDPALGFLKLNTWIDLTSGVADEDAIGILASAILCEPPGPQARQRSEAIRAAICPYRGLRPFREEDEPFFFGRSAFTDALTTAAVRQPFVAVIGASGSGKSSVVRAGLIPRLRKGEGAQVWDALTFVPGDRPLINLAAALLPALQGDLSEVDRLAEIGRLAAHLADGTVGLRDVLARVLAKQPGTDRLLLFVDQWEELYTLCSDDVVRRAFIEHLLGATATDAVHVVLTLRGDFVGHALASRELSDRLQDAVVTVGPMTREELTETITRPAERVGLVFETGLVESILDDVGDEPGNLPLLEFLLEGLWAERRGNVLCYDAYQRHGRVAGAIAYRAEDVFARTLTEAEREAAQRLLIRMVRPGDGMEDTRRRAALPESDAVVNATIRKLAGERLVVTERNSGTGEVTVELAHEALIRGWLRLRGWVDQDREFLRTRERLAAQARLWEAEGRSVDRLLPRGRWLVEGEDLLANRRADLEPLLVTFIEVSGKAARTNQRRRRWVVRGVVAAMAVITIIAIAAGQAAHRQRTEAERNLEVAQRAQSRAFAALAQSELEIGSPATALRVALAAVPENLAHPERAYVREAEGTIVHGLGELRERRRFQHEKFVSSVAFSPDGRTLATGSWDKARLWDTTTGKEIAALSGHESFVLSVAFSPDGRTLATGSWDNSARLWDVATGKETLVLNGHTNSVLSVAFSPDGRTLASASSDGTARLWDLATGETIKTLTGHTASVASVAFSPDGTTVATASFDATTRLWDVATGKQLTTIGENKAPILSVAFSPDGEMLATGSSDTTARVYEIATGKQIAVFGEHEKSVPSVAFSPDGRTLVTSSEDRTARLWDIASGKEIAVLRGHENSVLAVAFSPDGQSVATGSSDYTARLWDVAASAEIVDFRGHTAPVLSVAFSPDGRTIATGSEDKTARLWDVATGKTLVVFRDHEDCVPSVAFSPDGRFLATGSWDKTARLWEVTGRPVATFRGHDDFVLSVAFSPDGRLLATGSTDTTARLWEVATGKQILVLRGHAAPVLSVAFSPDGQMLATGSADNTARLWEVATGKEVIALRGHDYNVLSVAFSPDGRTIATGSSDSSARLWEIKTGKEIVAYREHDESVTSVALAPDGRTLASGSWDKTARLWDVMSGKEIATLRGHQFSVLSVAISPDGRMLASGSGDKTARLWPVGQGLIDLACARVENLPLSAHAKQRFGIEHEWCTPEISAALRGSLGVGDPPTAPESPPGRIAVLSVQPK
ncbi:MAG: TIR domain-containing protein [Rhodospirillales bacterium]|nr:TIR domain-containing protein [Rhodospirillales bacterium]